MDKKRDSFFLQKEEKRQVARDGEKNLKNKQERQKNFDNNREGLPKKDNEGTDKKPFDKKTYRLKKYSKKYKLEQWEEQRKKKLMYQYQKSMKNDSEVSGKYMPVSFDDDVPDSSTEVGRFVKHPDLLKEETENLSKNNKIKKNPFQKAKEQYNKMQQEKLEKKLEKERSIEERNKKLQEYKKKKHDRFKKLSKKNKKGQPVMTGRLELLLEKIQKNS